MSNANLKVNITGDSSKLNNALTSASSKLQSFGSKMQSVGKSMTTKLTLPIVAAGAAATKMAFDFDKSMSQITSLVGIAGNEVAKMGETAKKMAIDTGRSANEAAEALFFITSAGLRGADATDTLNASLKASAVGLGETKVVADLATSAMNAYGIENLNAGGATDVLVAAVREGKLEASELAGAMGGVLPIASNMGVEFHEVGAALAAMSRTGTNAANGATQLNAIMMSLQKPTDQAEQTLNTLGLTFNDLTTSVSEQGLMGTLASLKERLKGTGVEMSSLFPNVRALKGVMDLTGAGMQDNIKIFSAMENTLGATDEAFQKTSQTASFQMTQGLNAMKSSLLSVGQVILNAIAPAVQKLGQFFTMLSEKFNALSPTTQKIIIGIVGFVAALGPLIAIIGTLMTMAPAIGAALTVMTGPIGLVIAALTAVAVVIMKNWKPIKSAIIKLANYFIELYNNSVPVQLGVNMIIMHFKNLFAVGKAVFSGVVKVFKAFGKAAMGILGGVGDILMGVFTLDMAKIKSGFSGIGNAMKKGFTQAVSGVKMSATQLGNDVVNNFNNALEKKKIAKLKVETEGDTTTGKGGVPETNDVTIGDTKDVKIEPTAPSVDLPVNPVLNTEGVDKLKKLNEEINKALVTNDAKAYQERKNETIKYYDDLIKQVEEGSEKEKALQQAKKDTLAKLEMDENSRMLDLKQQILDSTNATDEQQKALELERIKLHYDELRALAAENGLLTAEQQKAFDDAQAEQEALVYDEKKERFLGFMMSMSEAQEMMQQIGAGIDQSFGALTGSITKAFGGAESASGAFVGTLAKDTLQIIGHNLKAAMANSIDGATMTAKSFGPAAAFVLPALIAGATALVSSSFAKFAAGGIVSGPTMGLVGEYPGARQNPEVIAPLNKLQNMIGGGSQNVNVTGNVSVSGQDLLIALERANETADRIY